MNVNDMLVDQIRSVREMTLATFGDFADDERFYQPSPGMNHPVWLLGHIAHSEDHLILAFGGGGAQLPEHYAKLFAMGSLPQSDPTAYPPVDEILDRLAAIHRAAVEWVRSASAETLDARPKGWDTMPERPRALFASRGRCVWFHANHEAMHLGQLSQLRRLLGKPWRV